MARKTTKVATKQLERYEERMRHYEEILRVKNLGENVPNWIAEKTVDYWMGCIDSLIASTEGVLFDENCYHGFYHCDENRERILLPESMNFRDNEKFRDWRRCYYTKG